MHEIGNYYVENGSILSRNNPSFMLDNEVAILVDVSAGALLKIGKRAMVEDDTYRLSSTFVDSGLEMITFNIKCEDPGLVLVPDNYFPELSYGTSFNIDEICTVVNWFSNCIGEQMRDFLELYLEDAKNKIRKLQTLGF